MPSNARNLANLLGAGETTISAEKLGSDVAPGTEDYSSIDSLGAGTIVGETAFVEGSNRLYIWNGSGWYNIALINTTPTWDSNGQPASSYELDADSPQDATVITLAASDPEGLPISYNYITSGSMDSIATISQDSSVFTITPKTSTQVPDGGTGSITFRATDGVNILPQVSSFTLNFITIVTNSKYTTLLVTATGTSDNNNITDSSTNNHTITVSGDAHAGTFSPYRSGGYSVHLDDGEEISFPDSANYHLSNGSFSIEAWVYPTSYDSPWSGVISQFSSSNRGWGLAFSSTQITFLGSTNGGSSTNVLGSVTSSVPLNRWTHLLVTRDSNTIRIFNNGVLVNNFTESGTFNNSTNPLRIGELNSAASENFRGYLRDIRFLKGSIPTEYQTSSTTNGTTIFSVPSEPLTAVTDTVLLTCHLPYISDGSANDATPTLSGNVSIEPFSPYDYNEYNAADHGGSVYFDGTDDYVEMPGHSSLVLDTSNFTLEFWYKHVANVTTMRFLGNNYQNSTWGGGRWTMGIISGKLMFQSNSLHGTGNYTSSTVSIDDGAWHHCSLTRDGSTFTLRVDGNDSATYTNSGSLDGGNSYGFTVGGRGNGTETINGYISDFKLVKGTVHYTADFTPPTAPLSSSGAALHIKGTDASIIDKSQGSNLKLIGNTTGSTTQVKFSNTKSMYFDGTGDYIRVPADDSIFSKDYTIEFWMYPTQDTNLLMPFSKGVGLQFYHQSGNIGAAVSSSNSGTYFYNGNFGSITTNAWSHISLVRDSSASTYKFYINGTLEDTLSSSTNINAGSADWIIAAYSTAGNYAFEGYIQDVRVTEGLARYTTSFTPPTASLEG